MHCTQCGQQLPSSARFCPGCGGSVDDSSTRTGSQAGSQAGSGVPPPPSNHAYAPPPLRPTLTRPRHNRMIAGVCAAFARTYGWNVTLVRVILVVLALHLGTGILAYIIAWILIPEEPLILPPHTAYTTSPGTPSPGTP